MASFVTPGIEVLRRLQLTRGAAVEDVPWRWADALSPREVVRTKLRYSSTSKGGATEAANTIGAVVEKTLTGPVTDSFHRGEILKRTFS